MIRKYRLKKKLPINKLLTLVKTLPEISSNTFYWNGIGKQYFVSEFPQIFPYQENILACIPDNLYKPNLEIQVLSCVGTIDSHKDKVSKRCILIPIKCSKNTFLWEEDKEVILELNTLYTFNDFNYHGLVTQHTKAKTIFIGVS